MMSTQSKAEHGVIQSSSIGLLRERFRQLERVKEMRENKELLRMFSDYKHTNSNTNINNNNNNNATCTNGVNQSNNNPIIVSTSTNSTTTTSTITRDHNININISDTTMQYNDNNNNNDDDEQLQIFIPPNYMSNNNPKASCYSSPLLPSTTTTSTKSSSLSSYNNNNHNINININDISLSLWPPTAYSNHAKPQSSEDLLSTMNILRATTKDETKRPSYCVLNAYKMDESHHVSDVDTTLHL